MSIVKRQVITPLVLAGFLAASSAFAQPTDADMTELRRLREQSAEKWVTLQKTRRFFPRCGSDDFMSGILMAKAASFGVTDFSLIPDQRNVPVLLHDEYPSPLRIESFEMRGRGAFSTLFRLLLFVARFREVGVVRFVTMNLTATGGAIQLVTRIGQACWDEGVEVWSVDGECAAFIATTKLDAPPDQELSVSSATVFAIRPSGLCGRLSSRP